MRDETVTAPFERVGVVGGGAMGGGIAELCARAGIEVLVVEPDDGAWGRLCERLAASVGKRPPVEGSGDDVLARVVRAGGAADLAECGLVVEALPESADLKRRVLAEVSAVLPPGAVLGSNTSSIPLAELSAAVTHPGRFLGVHFFNPPTVMPLVELVPTLVTTPDALERAGSFVGKQLGKVTITAPDRAGFVVNALLVPFLLAAARMYESGHATAEDIDLGMVNHHPMGPLSLMDMIGLDVIAGVAASLHAEYGDPAYLAPPLLRRMVQSGHLGRKSGRGFFEYSAKP